MAVRLLFEMANFRMSDTGLPVNIWIDESGSSQSNKHSIPRIKFQNNYSEKADRNSLIPISIDNAPKILSGVSKIKSKDLNIIKRFIKLNIKELLDHWNGDISTIQLYSKLKLPINCDLYNERMR